MKVLNFLERTFFPQKRENLHILRCQPVCVLPLPYPCQLSFISPVSHSLTFQNDVFWEHKKEQKMAQMSDPLKAGLPFCIFCTCSRCSFCLLHTSLLNSGCWPHPWLSLTQASRRMWQACLGDQRDKKDIYLTH